MAFNRLGYIGLVIATQGKAIGPAGLEPPVGARKRSSTFSFKSKIRKIRLIKASIG